MDVKRELLLLHQYGVINYASQKDSPQLTLLLNRMYSDSFVIDLQNYLERKKNFETRITAMIDYILDKSICRSKMIAAYFNDHQVKECGICDNCIGKKTGCDQHGRI